MRSRLPFLLFVLILASGFAAIPAHADDVLTYDMTGSFTLVGYDLCSGPCTETFDFSAVLTLTPVAGPVPDVYQATTTSLASSAYGALGDFSGIFAGLNQAGYFGFFPGPDFNEVDMYLNGVGSSYYASLPITFASAAFYTCASAACRADFFNSVCSGLGCIGSADQADLTTDGVITLTAAVPEPSTLTLLLTGMFILGLAAAFRRNGFAHLLIARHRWLRCLCFRFPKNSQAIGMG